MVGSLVIWQTAQQKVQDVINDVKSQVGVLC